MTRAERATAAADAMYEKLQAARQQIETSPMGGHVTDAMTATRDEIRDHYVLCAELAYELREHNVVLDPEKLWGKDVIAVAEQKAARSKRRAGYKTLKARYGDDAAKAIIRRAREAQ